MLRVPFLNFQSPAKGRKIRKSHFSPTKGRRNRKISTFYPRKDRNLVKFVPIRVVKFTKFSFVFSFLVLVRVRESKFGRHPSTCQLAILVPPGLFHLAPKETLVEKILETKLEILRKL